MIILYIKLPNSSIVNGFLGGHIDSFNGFSISVNELFSKNECVFIFDEYENYPGWEDHEYKAFNEWLAKNKDISAERIAEVINNEQVAFKVTI